MGQNKSPSGIVVVIFLFIFWPLGLYLLYKKVTSDKTAAIKNSKTLVIVGWTFIVFGIFYIIGTIGDPTVGLGQRLSGIIFFVGGGIFMIYSSKKIKIIGEKYKKYINIVINNQQTSIENIASSMSLSCEQVIKDLQGMIDKGYFLNAYIDLGKNEIVFPYKEPFEDSESSDTQMIQQRIVICKNCGGNNTVTIGKVSECEFCASPIFVEY